MNINVTLCALINALIVVIDRNAERNFCLVLPNDILIEIFLYLSRGRQMNLGSLDLFFAHRLLVFIVNYSLAKLHTFVANINTRACNYFFDLVLCFLAKRTANVFLPSFVISKHTVLSNPFGFICV